jgi:threonyl-tRNA synthetase
MEDISLKYDINEGDGAFYGPKIDIKLKDALDRSWQCATIQCDFTLPDRFDLSFIDQEGQKQRPVMIHRVILGSVERFIGVLIEHYAGAFPLWIAPIQARILTVTERNNEYAETLLKSLKEAGIRAEADLRNEKLGLKVREAQLQKIPYMLVIGDREAEQGGVTPRLKNGKNLAFMTGDEIINHLKEEERQRR